MQIMKLSIQFLPNHLNMCTTYTNRTSYSNIFSNEVCQKCCRYFKNFQKFYRSSFWKYFTYFVRHFSTKIACTMLPGMWTLNSGRRPEQLGNTLKWILRIHILIFKKRKKKRRSPKTWFLYKKNWAISIE